jgi:hypothetical protein
VQSPSAEGTFLKRQLSLQFCTNLLKASA